MIDPAHVPEVGAVEMLARYALFSGHIRNSDKTLKADAFMPPPDRELSTTRHLSLSEAEIWMLGEAVAAVRRRTLIGRGDIQAKACIDQKLVVHAAPLAENPNHAHVVNWPADKPAQKMIAQEIAAVSQFVEKK